MRIGASLKGGSGVARVWHMMVVLLLVLLVLSQQPLVGASAPAVTPGGTLTIAVYGEGNILDPQLSFSGDDQVIIEQVFDRLFTYDPRNKLQPLLAKSWKNLDPLTWVIAIHQGVKFHNGREMVAEDVKYSFDRLMDPKVKALRRRLSMVQKVEVVDKYTVKITLKNPYPPFLHVLFQPQTAIVPREEVERFGDNFGRNLVGSGPFRFKEWRAGDRIVLERNNDYWLKKPNIERLIFRTILEPSVALLELLSGRVDVVAFVPPDDLPRLRGNPNVQVGHTLEAVNIFLAFNVAEDPASVRRISPLRDLRVRQAVYHAVDWDAVTKTMTVYPEYGERSYGAVPSSVPFYVPSAKKFALPYDPNRARALLADAGYPRGFRAELLTWNKVHEKAGLLIQSYLREVGVDLQVKFLVLSAWVGLVNSGDFDMYVARRLGMVDPDEYLYEQFYSANWGSRGNRMRYKNGRVDLLLEEGQREMNPVKRLAFYQEAERILLQEIPHIPIYTSGRVIAWNRRVQDVVVHPQPVWPVTTPFNNIWIRK